MKRFFATLAILLCLASLCAFHQGWDYIANGNKVTGICEYQGQIWASTEAGLCVIDPATNSISILDKQDTGLPLGALSDITLDRDGTPWAIVPHFGTASFEDGNWDFHYLQTQYQNYWTLQNNPAMLRIDTSNRKWMVFYQWQLLYAEGHDFTPYPSFAEPWINSITALYADDWGTQWAAFEPHLDEDYVALCKIGDPLEITYLQQPQYPFSRINCITSDAPDQLWMGTDLGILRKLGDNLQWFDHQSAGLPAGDYRSLGLDAQNNPVFGSESGWLAYYTQGQWHSIDPTESGIGSKEISHILIDSTGDWWIGTERGLYRKSGNTWTHFPTTEWELPENNIQSLLVGDDGSIWLSMFEGLARINGDEISHYSSNNSPLLGDNPKVLGKHDGKIWIGSDLGLYVIDGDSWISHPLAEIGDFTFIRATDIAFTADGSCWISTSGQGLLKYDGTSWTVYTPQQIPLGNANLSSVEIDLLGRVWLSSSTGVAFLDGETWTLLNAQNSPLPDSRVTGIALAPNGYLWFSTMNGLAAYTGSWWMSFTEITNGLPTNNIYDVWADESGAIWFYMLKHGLGKTDGYSFEFFSATNSGLPDNSITGLDWDSDGIYYFGTTHGVGIWDPDDISINEASAASPIQALKLWPNPFRSSTNIVGQIDKSGKAELKVYNMRGQLVRRQDLGHKNSGRFELAFDGQDSSGQQLSSGVYIFKLSAGGQSSLGKGLILK